MATVDAALDERCAHGGHVHGCSASAHTHNAHAHGHGEHHVHAHAHEHAHVHTHAHAHEHAHTHGDGPSLRERLLLGASGATLVAGLVAEHALRAEDAAVALYVVAAILGLVFIAPAAFASLRHRTADMNVLMAIAVIGALALGFAGDTSTFADAGIVIFLYQIGEWLEDWSMERTSGSIHELMRLAPDVAHVVGVDDTVRDEQVADLAVGTTIRILPGERVPLDGVVVRGTSALNEAAVTGESIPADKAAGDAVYAGSLNTAGVLDVSVSAAAGATTLDRVVAQVQGAQANKAPYESFVNRFAAVYTPLVVAGAAFVGVAVPAAATLVVGGAGAADIWREWVYRALSLLVVACPCALVISTPVSFVSAITRAARDGVLVKGGAAFDVAAHLTAVALDKTGTLTTGEPSVVAVVPLGGAEVSDVLRVAGALEAVSTHPLARAVCAEVTRHDVVVEAAEDATEIAASGVTGVVGGVVCAIGKGAFVSTVAEVGNEAIATVAEVSAQGATALVVAADARVVGIVGVADSVRAEAAEAVSALAAAGVTTTMLTGDNAVAAAAVAQKVGVGACAAGLLPADKVAEVKALQADGVVAMVGDGINDAPALAASDLGVTMGATASDTALEVADVALLGNDLRALPAFLALSRHTMRVVRENIVFAICIKATVFVLVIAGVAGMGAAVFADTGVSLIVILNGMRLMLGRRH